MTTRLTYKGGGFLIGVPARDLTDQDFADFTQVEDRDVLEYLNLAEEAMLARMPSSPAS